MDDLDLDALFEVDFSSNIAAVGSKDHFLVVQFHKGNSVYRYPHCAEFLEQVYTAESVGTAFREIVLPVASGERLADGWPDDD